MGPVRFGPALTTSPLANAFAVCLRLTVWVAGGEKEVCVGGVEVDNMHSVGNCCGAEALLETLEAIEIVVSPIRSPLDHLLSELCCDRPQTILAENTECLHAFDVFLRPLFALGRLAPYPNPPPQIYQVRDFRRCPH